MGAQDRSESGVLRSRSFWQLFATCAALVLVTGTLVGWLVRTRMETGLLGELDTTLRSACQELYPLAAAVLGDPERDPQAVVASEFARLRHSTDLRVTLVALDGRVVADSHEDARTMGDHSSRPEVIEARGQPFGSARRVSRTVGTELLYVAQRVERDGTLLGFVRVALPAQPIERQLADATRAVLLGSASGILLAFFLALLLMGGITRPLAALERTAREFQAGNYTSRVPRQRHAEFGRLGAALDALGAETTRRIAALSQEDAQLRAVLASMIEGVVAVGEDGRVAFMNQAARELLEVVEPAPEGRPLWNLAPIRELEELLDLARRTGGLELREVDLFRGGKERVFQAHASPFQGGGKSGFVLVLHDITELRRLERVRRDFVANVSHELKTPLTSIQGFVETLLSGALQDERHNVQFLKRIEANVKRLTSLVSDLLSLARIESGALEVESAAVDWREVLEGVLRLREPALAAKGLTLTIEGRERPLRVRGDREAMTQVLDNLIDNAIQYTPAPGRLMVRLASQDGHGQVAVEDSGIGIPAADLDRIFERFYRVDRARSRAAGGTGLGLSIVKNLVLRMQGEVRVESVEGKGSTFTVRLPLV